MRQSSLAVPAVEPLYLVLVEASLLLNGCNILRLELERRPGVAHDAWSGGEIVSYLWEIGE